MSHDKRSFWSTLPGILTGVAAIITAVAALYVALSRDAIKPSTPENTIAPAPTEPASPLKWPLIGEETFTVANERWYTGVSDTPRVRSEHRIASGKYRWDLECRKPAERYVPAPYRSAANFFVAVDTRMVAFSPGKKITASLGFGRTPRGTYSFVISSNKQFALIRHDGTGPSELLYWTAAKIDPAKVNRLGVYVDNQVIKLYLNADLVGEYRDPSFGGGQIELAVGCPNEGTSATVEFDNFEYRSMSP